MNTQERKRLTEFCKVLLGDQYVLPNDLQKGNTFSIATTPDGKLFGHGVELELTVPADLSLKPNEFAISASLRWTPPNSSSSGTTLHAEFRVELVNNMPRNFGFALSTDDVAVNDFLQDLGSLFPNETPDWHVPDILPTVTIKHLELKGQFSVKQGLQSFQAQFNAALGSGGEGWSPLKRLGIESELFELRSLGMSVHWAKRCSVTWQVSGTCDFENAYRLNLQYRHPSSRVYVQLHPLPDAKQKLNALLGHLNLDAGVTRPITDILSRANVSVDADIARNGYEFRFSNGNDPWKICHEIEVSNIEFRAYYIQKKIDVEMYLDLDLPIGPRIKNTHGAPDATGDSDSHEPVTIELEATYGSSGWSFHGETGLNDVIEVGSVVEVLANKFGCNGSDARSQLPEAISTAQVHHFELYFDNHGEFDISIEIELSIDGRSFRFWVHMHRESGEVQVSGSILIGKLQLAVAFSVKGSDKCIVGSLQAPLSLDAKELVGAINPGLVDSIPIDAHVNLKGVLLAMHMGPAAKGSAASGRNRPRKRTGKKGGKQSSAKDFVFRLAFGIEFDLSGLPLIGQMLQSAKFENMQLLAANQNWNPDALGIANKTIDVIQPMPPAPLASPKQSNATVGIAKGISLSGTFLVADKIHCPLFLQFGGEKSDKKPGDSKHGSGKKGTKGAKGTAKQRPTNSANTPPVKTNDRSVAKPKTGKPDARSQSKVDKVIGAVRVKKVNLIFDKGKIGLKVTGGLALAAFEFELIGMQVTVPQAVLNDPKQLKHIDFSLDGFSAAIQKGTLSIMGAFLRKHHEDRDEAGQLIAYDEYTGIVAVSFPPFSLVGMGSYAKYRGHTSLFLFVALGFPISVHPSLIIEGMALGFGIHRDFITPEPANVLDYPLVAVAVTPPPPIDVASMVESIHKFFPPSEDSFFVVAGVKFKAFGLVDSLVMLAVKAGRSFEISLIGVSSILFPAAFIELAWVAKFIPAKGYLYIGGQLSARSFLLIPQVQLTGGFAVAAWLAGDHKGDFVVSVGGYHPTFRTPAHYPDHIPRLGISFHLGPADIKGNVYFAITPQCVMMGGHLSASVNQSPVEAFIRLAFDAIIYFEPFHYDVLITADAAVKVEIPMGLTSLHIDKHLHVDLHIWGPEFSGTASLDVGPKTFKISIGDAASNHPLPIEYKDFKQKFLSTVCSVNVKEGLLRKATDESGRDVYVVDARTVMIEARSVVPLTNGRDKRLGIVPMDIRGKGFKTRFEVSHSDEFATTKLVDTMPAGIWGSEGLQPPDLTKSEKGLINNVWIGYQLKPSKDRESPESNPIDKEALSYNTDRFTLKDRAVDYGIVPDGESTATQQPIDLFEDFTGLQASQLHPVIRHELLESSILTYELV